MILERQQSAAQKKFVKIIACDFDGTLCVNNYPEIGTAKSPVIHALKLEQDRGAAIILWTCRSGEQLTQAIDWCANHGLYFDAVNENIPSTLAWMGDSRKVFAHEYWDDRAVNIKEKL